MNPVLVVVERNIKNVVNKEHKSQYNFHIFKQIKVMNMNDFNEFDEWYRNQTNFDRRSAVYIMCPVERLNQELMECLDIENYERAAEIRDELLITKPMLKLYLK